MKVLQATSRTQGQRSNDFDFCRDGELVVLPALVCCDGRGPDGPCGCGRALAGVDSQSGTTTAVVADADMTEPEWERAVAASYVTGGWFRSVDSVAPELIDDNRALLAAIDGLPVDTVVECRGGVLAPRAE